MSKTIDYYNRNSNVFVQSTVDVDFHETQDKFLAYMPDAGKILDFGCGAGRDTKYFLNQGYAVDAIDGSEELCKIASENTGIKVRRMLFDELDAVEEYDGIWACASILHLAKKGLVDVISKMVRATKTGGYIYTSFKYGEFEGERNERYFIDFTKETFRTFIKQFIEVVIIEEWVSADVRPGRGDEKWLNIIMRKSNIR